MAKYTVRGYAYYHELVQTEVEADDEDDAFDLAESALREQEHKDKRSRFWGPTLNHVDDIEVEKVGGG